MRKKSVTVRQIQKLDEIAIKRYGVPSLALMENAGRSVAEEVIKAVKKNKRPKICVICGLGNNAGDGFVIARHLINKGTKVSIHLIGKGSRLKTDAAVNYRILKKLKYPIYESAVKRTRLFKDIQKADAVVDAIFGVGLNRDVKDPFKSVIDAINQRAKKVVSVDTPSGLDGTSGKIYSVCVKADKTVTFTFLKKGFLINQGPAHTGKMIVVDIGIPLILQKGVK